MKKTLQLSKRAFESSNPLSFLLTFYLIFNVGNAGFSQCFNDPCPVPVQHNNPALVCVLPSPDALDCHVGSTNAEPVIVNIPNIPFWCTTIENNHFYAFEADATSVTFEIECLSCTAGEGVQAAVLYAPDCTNFQMVSNCENIEEGNSATIEANNLIIGAVYFLMFDGRAGGLCEYVINNITPQITGTALGNCIPPNFFQGYWANVFSQWTVHPPSAAEFAGSDKGENVEIMWVEEGYIELCAENLECPNGPTTCVSLTVGDPFIHTFEETAVCDGGTVICGGEVITTSGVYEYNLTSWLGCDSMVTCIVDIIPEAFSNEFYEICEGECIECGGEFLCDGGFYEIVLHGASWQGCDSTIFCEILEIDIPTTFVDVTSCGDDCYEVGGEIYCETLPFNIFYSSANGCDSIIRVTPTIINVDADIAEPDALTCLTDTVILNALGSTEGDSVRYEWTGPNNFMSHDFPELTVTAGGTYCLSVLDTLSGAECIECVDVAVISNPPDEPEIYGPSVIFGDFALYETDAVPFATNCHWNGISIVAENENQILIDVSNQPVPFGEVCLTVENDCGVSPEGCFFYEIDDLSFNLEIVGPTELCNNNGPFTYLLINDDTSVTNVEWQLINGFFTQPTSNDLAVVNWQNGIASAGICADIESNQFGNYQICQLVEFIPADTTILDISVCDGECFDYNGTDLCDPGIFEFLFTNSAGCDSLVQVYLALEALPTAHLINTNTQICGGTGETVDLEIDFTGTPPWTFEYQINGAIQTSSNVNSSPYQLTVDESQAGLIELTIVVDNNSCLGSTSGAANVEVIPPIEVSNVAVTFSPTNTEYLVSFEISGGDPATYSVTGTPGIISSFPPYLFTSDPIVCGDGYAFEVSDGTGCPSVQISSTGVTCDCETQTGDMDLTPIESCGDGPITGTFDNTNLVFDANDILNFILHKGNSVQLIDIIRVEITPTFSFNPALMSYGETYYISAVAGNDDGTGNVDLNDPCAAVSVGTPIVFYEVPTAVIYGNESICEGSGETVDLTLEFTGDSPWTVEITDGTTTFSETYFNNPALVAVSQPGLYTISSFTDENCPGDFSGSATITEDAIPTATITGGGNLCEGSSQTVAFEIILTGTAPWSLDWGVNGAPQAPLNIPSSPFIFEINENQAGVIGFYGVSDANCVGIISGQDAFPVEVLEGSKVTSTTENCNATNTEFQVIIEIESMNPPIMVNPSNGTISGSGPYIFTSDFMPNGSNYSFEISDATSCSPVFISGNGFCDCATYVDDMVSDFWKFCEGQTGQAVYLNGHFLDGNDVLNYVIYTDSLNIVGSILDINLTEPSFDFDPATMNFGTIYYVAAVAGNNDGTGLVDFNDPCLDFSSVVSRFIWLERPTAHLSSVPSSLCENDIELTVEFTGEAPFEFVWSNGTNNFTETGITSNPYIFSVTPNVPETYVLISVEDSNCDGIVSGEVEILTTANPEITSITSDTTICAGEHLGLNVESPTAVSYEWSPSNSLDCSNCLNPIAAPTENTNYTVTVTDAQGCTAEENVEVFEQCFEVYDTLDIGELTIQSLNLPPWLVLQADVCLDEDEHTSIGWFPNGLFYVGLSEGQDTICILLQHPTNVFNTEVFTIYVTVQQDDPFSLTGDDLSDFLVIDEGKETKTDLTNFENLSNQITIYPNPTKEILNIKSENEPIRHIEIFDLSGRSMMKTDSDRQHNRLNISQLNAGTYFIRIHSESDSFLEKIVKVH